MQINYRFIFLLLIASINIFWGISNIPLLDPDEPAYAQTAKEMFLAADYLSPRIFGDFWFDKPPMYYWLVIASYKIFGISEFAARFPASLFALSTILFLYFKVRKHFNENIAFNSAIILSTCINFFYLAKASVTDMVLLFFLTATLLSYFERKYAIMFIFASLATLTKGPVGFIFPGIIIFIHACLIRNFSLFKARNFYLGFFFYCLFTLPWYFLMYKTHGQIFIDTFLGLHNIARFTNAEHTNRVLWYFYFPVLIIGLFPWINFFISSIYNAYNNKNYQDKSFLLFLQIWWIFIFIFFSIAKTKLVSYIFPLFPPLSIILAWNFEYLNNRYGYNKNYSLIFSTLFFYGLFIAVWIVGPNYLPELTLGANYIVGATSVTLLLVIYSLLKNNFQAILFTQTFLGLIIMFTVMQTLLPAMTNFLSVKSTANFYATQFNNKNIPVYVDKFLRPGFAFYSNIYGQEVTDTKNINFNTDAKNSIMLSNLIKSNDKSYNLVIRRLMYNRLTSVEKNKLEIILDNQDILILKNKVISRQ